MDVYKTIIMKVGILTANLGGFDENFEPVEQNVPNGIEVVFHKWTDINFPPITGLTPRFQYRIPKLFGWQMFPDCDFYLWLDGSMSLQHPNCLKWFIGQIEGNDMVLFRHPERSTIKSEVDFIEKKIKEGNKYLLSRYENGLGEECYGEIIKDGEFVDDQLFASTVFVYRNTRKVQKALKDWWFWQSRFWSCDQIPLPYVLWKNKIKIKTINENVFDFKYLTLASKHK